MKAAEASRRYCDPAGLTPYEQRIWAFMQQGMSAKQIEEALNGTSTVNSLYPRMKIIREKIALKEITDAQSRRISWG